MNPFGIVALYVFVIFFLILIFTLSLRDVENNAKNRLRYMTVVISIGLVGLVLLISSLLFALKVMSLDNIVLATLVVLGCYGFFLEFLLKIKWKQVSKWVDAFFGIPT